MPSYQPIADELASNQPDLILNRSLTIGGKVSAEEPFERLTIHLLGCKGLVKTWADGRFVIAGLPCYSEDHTYSLLIALDHAAAIQQQIVVPARTQQTVRNFDIHLQPRTSVRSEAVPAEAVPSQATPAIKEAPLTKENSSPSKKPKKK